MLDLSVAPWQVPLLTMAAVAVLAALLWLLSGFLARIASGAGWVATLIARGRIYAITSTLAVPTFLLALVALGFIGPPVTDRLTQAATTVTAIIGAFATFRSFRADQRVAENRVIARRQVNGADESDTGERGEAGPAGEGS